MATQFTYLQLAQELRREIAEGKFAAGERLPSIRALSARFGVAAATAQKALSVLAEEGAVKAGSTRGYFTGAVSDHPPVALPEIQRFSALESQMRELTDHVSRLAARIEALESDRSR